MKAFHCSIFLVLTTLALHSCKESTANTEWSQPPPTLPVITVTNVPATTYQEFTASVEGTNDVEIRPQVDGILQKIFVDEGAYVRQGQSLFQIDSRPFREQADNAKAALSAAKANLANAEINVDRLVPLVENKVISDVQLKTAEAARDAAKANVEQAQAMLQNANINLGYTLIKAPVDGYIGRVPFKTGSLMSLGMTEPLTVLSQTKEVYAYFSMSEGDFLQFKNQYPGNTVGQKIKQMPPVELVLADNTVHPHKGKVETVSGQFNHTTGSISFRAVFANPNGLLRSGNTGKVRIPRSIESALVVPQEATYELQDKVFVFVVADSSKVVGTPIGIAGRSGNYYLVESGLTPGQKIVYSGLDRLRDGAVIIPVAMSLDSLLKARPL